MKQWRQFPLVRIALAVFAGIATGIFCRINLQVPVVVPLILFFCYGLLLFFPRFTFSYSYRWINGILIFLITVLLSIKLVQLGEDTRKKDYFGNYQPIERSCVGEIIEPVVQKKKVTKVFARITFVKDKGRWFKSEGTAVISIARSSRSQLLCYGDLIVMNTIFTMPDVSRNPGGFDNKHYLQLKGIYRQAYVKRDRWRLLSHGNRNPVFNLALSWRDRMLMILRGDGMKGREFAVAGALLLGYVDEIDNELRQDYSATGLMHIIVVSGMHVGIVFILLEKLLVFLNNRKRGPYIKAGVLIICIWLYAMVTGLSPPVSRASVMLSMVVIGKAMDRRPHVLNVMAASAIFLLIRQPLLLVNPGFQISYVAVTGIVLLFNPVHSLFLPNNGLVDKIWSIVAVSIVAQLSILPLCLYYFHQFPNYFIFTNIIIVPLANLIIYTGIGALALGNVPWISLVIAKVLSFMIWFLNSFIHRMASFPYAVSRGIVFTLTESIILELIIVTAIVFMFRKRKMWLFISLGFMILLSVGILKERIARSSVSSITVYDIRGKGLVDFVTGGKSILVGDMRAMNDPFFLDAFTKSRWNEKVDGLFEIQFPLGSYTGKPFHYGSFYKRGNIISFQGKRIGFVTEAVPKGTFAKLRVDYLIISGSPKSSLKEILGHFSTRMVIIDGSNAAWWVKGWKEEAGKLGVRWWDVEGSGAFRVEWRIED